MALAIELLKKIQAAIAEGKDESGLLSEIVIAEASGGGESEPPAAASADPLAGAADPAAGSKKKEDEEQPAATGAKLSAKPSEFEQWAMTATGRKTPAEAQAALSASLSVVTSLESRQKALDLNERRALIADLVKLGAEVPATAWEGKPEDQVPSKRLEAEPLEDLKARVTALKSARPAPRGKSPAAPPADEEPELSQAELKACKDRGLTPKQFTELKARAVVRN